MNESKKSIINTKIDADHLRSDLSITHLNKSDIESNTILEQLSCNTCNIPPQENSTTENEENTTNFQVTESTLDTLGNISSKTINSRKMSNILNSDHKKSPFQRSISERIRRSSKSECLLYGLT